MELATPRFLPAGEAALVVEFGRSIDPALHAHVLALDVALARRALPGIVETVPTYRSLMIHFDPRLLTTAQLIDSLARLDATPSEETVARTHWVIPVCYDGVYAEDLAEVATALGLTKEQVVALHKGAAYRVYMYGFAPGYVFLGGLPDQLTISRRTTPRPPVPKGSLLIAGGQALIGHDPMPTGWYHIGRTPVATFAADRTPPCFIEVGDEISFEPIDAAAFLALEQAASEGAPIAKCTASSPAP